MSLHLLETEQVAVEKNRRKVVPMFRRVEDSVMSNDENKPIDHKDLELVEQRLTNKIDVSEAKLSGKIDTLTAKNDSQSKLLYWIMGIISAGIVVPLITMAIKYLTSK